MRRTFWFFTLKAVSPAQADVVLMGCILCGMEVRKRAPQRRPQTGAGMFMLSLTGRRPDHPGSFLVPSRVPADLQTGCMETQGSTSTCSIMSFLVQQIFSSFSLDELTSTSGGKIPSFQKEKLLLPMFSFMLFFRGSEKCDTEESL